MKLMRSGFGVAVLSLSAIAGGYFGGRPLLEKMEFSRVEADVQNTRQELSTVEDLSTVFRHVGKVVEPSVVKIEVTKTIKQDGNSMGPEQLRRFFRDHGMPNSPFDNPNNGNGNGDNDDQGDLREDGTGSGVIMDASNGVGYILTNNHVAGDGSVITGITLADGRVIEKSDCKLLGADPKSDLAVVQVKADRLIPAHWGNSDDLEKGDWVMAFGAPFGYVGSMTHGIVSALNRNEIRPGTQDYENYIQVDAPINPGNSGGPLVNIHGEVVGINTAIATVSGGFQGIGFAIPSDYAKTVYDSLKEHGKVVRGWLGVSIADVSNPKVTNVARSFGYTGDTGVFVQDVIRGSPAIGKLNAGDVITGVNGKPVNDVTELRNEIADMQPNSSVTLHIFRDEKEQDVTIKLGDQPEDLAALMNNGGNPDENGAAGNGGVDAPTTLGMQLKTLDSDTAESLGLGGIRSGAVITSVQRNSVAEAAGLTQSDVITEVGKTYVHNAQEATDALNKADLNKGVRLYIATREGSQFVFLQNQSQDK